MVILHVLKETCDVHLTSIDSERRINCYTELKLDGWGELASYKRPSVIHPPFLRDPQGPTSNNKLDLKV